MTKKLSHTPVAKSANKIFVDVIPGVVSLLEADTGAGKSLYSPGKVWDCLRGPVLVLVPSVDVARDNSRRIAELSDQGWKHGTHVGCYAGGDRDPGSCIMVATYGTFIVNKHLYQRRWEAILLDESHVEQWQVEVARADVRDRLAQNGNLFVMELSATMDAEKLSAFWKTAGEDIFVLHHKIPGQGTDFTKTMVEKPILFGDKPTSVCAEEANNRLTAGDRFIMVTQSGLVDVEICAEKVRGLVGQSASVYTYHGETDPDEIKELLSRLKPGERRIIVTTPRLLTGFNHEDFDSIVTDGYAKYPHSRTNGTTWLKRDYMSKYELTQALGRVGRFKDGSLILCSDQSYTDRSTVMVPEVERLNSLPLALGLVAIGRNPLVINFCNQPQDLPGSMQQLQDWGFVDKDLRVTDDGVFASKLEIRPDMAKFLLSVMNHHTQSIEAKAMAIIAAAIGESGGSIAFHKPKDEDGYPVIKPSFDEKSDVLNEVLRFIEVIKWQYGQIKRSCWVNRRSLRRVKSWVYRLVEKIDDNDLWEFFGSIFEEDEISTKSNQKGKFVESTRQKAWRQLGKRLVLTDEVRTVLDQALIQTMVGKLYLCLYGHHGPEGRSLHSDHVTVGNETVVPMNEGQLFIADQMQIVPRNGNLPFLILHDITLITPEDLAEACPEIYQIQRGQQYVNWHNQVVIEYHLLVNGIGFNTFEKEVGPMFNCA